MQGSLERYGSLALGRLELPARSIRRRSISARRTPCACWASRRAGVAHHFGRRRAGPCFDCADRGQSNPARQDRSRHWHGGAYFCADRCVPGIRCRVRSGGLRTGHSVGSGRSDHDPALLSRAGAPKSFPAQADVLAACNFCGSIFVDRLGRDLGARGSGFVAGDRPGHRRIRHIGRRLDAQPVTELSYA